MIGVADDVADLPGGQPDIDGVHHRPHAGDREIRLLVLLAVPAEGGHPVPGPHAQAVQGPRQLPRPAGQRAELDAAGAIGPAGDDLTITVQIPAMLKDVPDGERVIHHRAAHTVNLPKPAPAGLPSAARAARA